jgi:hypothetical protein
MGRPSDGLGLAPEHGAESERDRIERLGRQRPDKFSSIWKEAAFVYSVVMSQAITVRLILACHRHQ